MKIVSLVFSIVDSVIHALVIPDSRSVAKTPTRVNGVMMDGAIACRPASGMQWIAQLSYVETAIAIQVNHVVIVPLIVANAHRVVTESVTL